MNEVELTQLGIKDSRDLLNKKEISATELTNAYIEIYLNLRFLTPIFLHTYLYALESELLQVYLFLF